MVLVLRAIDITCAPPLAENEKKGRLYDIRGGGGEEDYFNSHVRKNMKLVTKKMEKRSTICVFPAPLDKNGKKSTAMTFGVM